MRSSLELVPSKICRCKNESKNPAGLDYFFPAVKLDLIKIEIEFEFFCRTF